MNPQQTPASVPDSAPTGMGTSAQLEAKYGHLIPEDFKQLGWSGTFMLEATLSEPDKAEEMAARLPDRVPFGANSGWLAVCLNRDVSPPTVVLVRRDENAIVDLVAGPRL